ncbi:MAG: L-2-hydroxyglutarate oxidase [Flavobacteriaceae bacterium]|nr:L-2-hydroxyglutarate oxidase [Flavobacteriaceae bacterium]MBT4950464.1 L-2-hydroxyglutarate oxidase [Pelagibacteraceae bacterium]MBT5772004.1 L-2-hydroxyglutarate oxidase [Flavobacteriaceae bacterium]MBT6353369.1 L-2-hydroxyglutarate oxidase [Pelagibacteraceae bacterium]
MKFNKNTKWDCTIIGAGIIGLTTAYKYQKLFPNQKVLLIEKERQIFMHQSGRNSGVIHSGIYYEPDSYKAKNCIKGYDELLSFAKKNKVPFKITGKLIIASQESDISILEKLFKNGVKNGLDGIKILDKNEALKIEPYCKNIIKALYVPQSGIINYKIIGNKLLEKFKVLGGTVNLSTQLFKFTKIKNFVNIQTNQGEIKSKKIIICSGISVDNFLSTSLKEKYRIFPFKGEYYYLRPSAKKYIKGLVYPVPNLKFPFLGVHLTKTIDGEVEAGPNAVLSLSRYGYNKTSFNLKDFFKIISWKGFWIFSLRFWKIGLFEMYRSMSKRQFTKSIQSLLPEIKESDLIRGKSGIRAQIMMSNGNLMDDFMIENDQNVYTVINAPSPAATSAFAISEQIINYIHKNES